MWIRLTTGVGLGVGDCTVKLVCKCKQVVHKINRVVSGKAYEKEDRHICVQKEGKIVNHTTMTNVQMFKQIQKEK